MSKITGETAGLNAPVIVFAVRTASLCKALVLGVLYGGIRMPLLDWGRDKDIAIKTN